MVVINHHVVDNNFKEIKIIMIFSNFLISAEGY